MDMHGNLNLMGNQLQAAAFAPETDFPLNPTPGRTCFRQGTLYFCTEILGGLPVWVPISAQITMVRYTQPTAQLEWTIPHTLNMSSVLVQVYDVNGKWIVPDAIMTDQINQVTVSFNTPTAGTAIIMRGETEGSPQPLIAFEEDFSNLDTWVVNHQLGYNPIITCIVGTNVVQPQSVVHNSTMQATVTFSAPQTGSVRCV